MRTVILIVATATGTANANNTLEVGDGQIDGPGLKPYEITWRQCSVQEGVWVTSADLTERLVLIGDGLLRIQQFSKRPGGGAGESTVYLDRTTMAPLRLEQRVTTSDGSVVGSTEHDLDKDGYHGRKTMGEQSQEVSGIASSTMLHGGAMGLPLATLGHQGEPLEFAASMIGFDATYKVIASWVGTEMLEYDGHEVEASMVDIEWIHNEIGDVYPGGPTESGGRYWLVRNPPNGFPYVPRYQTDTYAIEFVQGACPAHEN